MPKNTTYVILTDEELRNMLTPEVAVQVMEDAILEKANGGLVAPPKFSVETSNGRLVYTAGASQKKFAVNGFRVYSVYQSETTDQTQLVVVFDDRNGNLKGICIGSYIGVLRTAAINAVAIKHLSKPNSGILGVIGAGFQARHHVPCALAVRNFDKIVIYSRTRKRTEIFGKQIEQGFNVKTEIKENADIVAAEADVLICATNSRQPVFNPKVLRPGTHVNSIGPKF